MQRRIDLSQYETVKQRKARFYRDNPDGRIVPEAIRIDGEMAIFKVSIYRNKEEQEADLPWSTGHAQEIRDKELSESRSGQKYASVNYTSWCENCEESAIGRALDNAGYSSNGRCSQEEMVKVQRVEQKVATPKPQQPPAASDDFF
jgi:hypothetical protein